MLKIKYEMPGLKDLSGKFAFGDCAGPGSSADGAGCTPTGNTAINNSGAGCVNGPGATGAGGPDECSAGEVAV